MKKLLFLLFAVPFFITACNNDDDRPPKAPATGTISATRTSGATGQSAEWTMPSVTAKMDISTIRITASNPTTNEFLIFNLSNNGAATYFSSGEDPFNGLSLYKTGTGNVQYTSDYNSTSAFTFVTITEVDTTAKKLSGTFQCGVYNPASATDLFLFDNGTFEDVPYTGGMIDISSPTGTFSAIAGGTAYTPGSLFATTTVTTLTFNGLASTLTGNMTLTIPVGLGVGTHEMANFASDTLVVATYSSGQDAYLSDSGTLTITTHNLVTRKIEGTFSFADGPFQVTNGVINLSY